MFRTGGQPHPAESAHVRDMMLTTLDHMAAGGMHDHLGGGFHRYSVDRFWHVPHFEKMLYDQAQLVVAYLEAFQITGEKRFADVARDVLDYVRYRSARQRRDATFAPKMPTAFWWRVGLEHAEGAFYVWTKAEIEAALSPEEATLSCAHYGVEPAGNAPAGSDPARRIHGEKHPLRAYGQDRSNRKSRRRSSRRRAPNCWRSATPVRVRIWMTRSSRRGTA